VLGPKPCGCGHAAPAAAAASNSEHGGVVAAARRDGSSCRDDRRRYALVALALVIKKARACERRDKHGLFRLGSRPWRGITRFMVQLLR
jgi:hypothetical protein